MSKREAPASPVLPTDQFDQMLARLVGLPGGAHTQPTVVQDADFYGKVTSWMVQTVKHDGGETVFLTCVNGDGSARYVLPPRVLAAIDRQRAAALTKVRRRHGQRIAEERRARGEAPAFLRPTTGTGVTAETEAARLGVKRPAAGRRKK